MSTGRGPMFFKRVAQSPPVSINGLLLQMCCRQHTGHIVGRQLLTFNILHDHTQVPPGLKGAVHGHHKRVLSEGEYVSLHKGLLYLVPQNQVLLIDLLHGESLLRLFVPNQINSSVE